MLSAPRVRIAVTVSSSRFAAEIALTARWSAKCQIRSECIPVRILMTPEGTSEVAMISAKSAVGSGLASDASVAAEEEES